MRTAYFAYDLATIALTLLIHDVINISSIGFSFKNHPVLPKDFVSTYLLIMHFPQSKRQHFRQIQNRKQ
jgi:hypothetical protein